MTDTQESIVFIRLRVKLRRTAGALAKAVVDIVPIVINDRQPVQLRYNTALSAPHQKDSAIKMNTTIGKGITITGSIHAGEAVTIAGTVNGDVLASDHDVTVELGARVEGAVTAKSITVRGRSTGRLIARDVVRVQQSAAVKGDVAAPRLSLEDGATFNGSVEPAKADAAMIVAHYRNKNVPARPA